MKYSAKDLIMLFDKAETDYVDQCVHNGWRKNPQYMKKLVRRIKATRTLFWQRYGINIDVANLIRKRRFVADNMRRLNQTRRSQ